MVKQKKEVLWTSLIRRTRLQIIEQIYRGFAENSRLYRAFSRQSDKVGMCNISGICPIPLWRVVYVGILFL